MLGAVARKLFGSANDRRIRAYQPQVAAINALEAELAALAALGGGLADVIRTRVFVVDMSDWEAVARAHCEAFAEHPPASSLIGVNALFEPDILVEIEADAVIENFSAGVMEKLGLGEDALWAINPRLAIVTMPPFGRGGPHHDFRAYGSTVEQASGLPMLNGAEGEPPTMLHVALGDENCCEWPAPAGESFRRLRPTRDPICCRRTRFARRRNRALV